MTWGAPVPLGSVCRFVGGGTPSKENASFYGGDIPWATVRDMKSEEITRTEHAITPEAVKASSTNVIPTDTVVIATRVGLGKVCVLKQPTAINQDLRAVVPLDPKRLNSRYLFWWLKSAAPRIEAAGTGATVKGVTQSFVASLSVPVPPLAEQERIVAVLDEAFEAIATATANTDTAQERAYRLFEAALSSKLEQSTSTSVRLREVVDRLTNGYVGPIKGAYVKQGVPYLLARHVRDNSLRFDGATYITSEFNERHSKSTLRTGDVLLVQSGHIGHAAVVGPEHDGHNCHAMIVISPNPDKLLGQYLSMFFMSSVMKREFERIRSGSTVPHLTCKLVREIELPLPPLAIQRQLAADVRKLEVERNRLVELSTEKRERLRELKQSLLARAFSGELTSGKLAA